MHFLRLLRSSFARTLYVLPREQCTVHNGVHNQAQLSFPQRTLRPIAVSFSSAVGINGSVSTSQPSQVLDASLLEDHKLVFGDLTTWQLLSALIVYRACAVDAFVDRSQELLNLGLKVLGPPLLKRIIAPFYNHFVAGDNEEQLKATTQRLTDKNIYLLLCPGLETDLGSLLQQEQNTRVILDFLELSKRYASSGAPPTCHVKVSGLISADILATISSWYENSSHEERLRAVQTLGSAMEETRGQEDSTPPFNLPGLDKDDIIELRNFLPRWYRIGSKAKQLGIVLMVDAEYTYINYAINFLGLVLMYTFNRDFPTVWNTYQTYLKSAMADLVDDLNIADQLSTSYGVKLVRGAYMERERERARELNYPDPIYETFEDTSNNFNIITDAILEEICKQPSRRSIMIATNNEDSVRLATQRMGQLGLHPRSGNVLFGQIYGMAENVSVALAKSGYLTYKSTAYGPLEEVLPYLARRAAGNRAVTKGTKRERDLVRKELRRRLSLTAK